MTSHIGYSFECVCKYGFVGEYCEKGLYAFLIYYDSIESDNVFLFFFFLFLILQHHFIFLFRISPHLQRTEALLRGGFHGCI